MFKKIRRSNFFRRSAGHRGTLAGAALPSRRMPTFGPDNPSTINPQSITHMAALNSLKDLLIDELKDLHDAETQLVKALPKMAKAASSDQLKAGFSEHLE